MRLKDKVALISGGSRGMGAVEAKLFAAEGASVVIGDILEDEGRQVEAEINAEGGNARFVNLGRYPGSRLAGRRGFWPFPPTASWTS